MKEARGSSTSNLGIVNDFQLACSGKKPKNCMKPPVFGSSQVARVHLPSAPDAQQLLGKLKALTRFALGLEDLAKYLGDFGFLGILV